MPLVRLGAAERLACLRLIRSENVGPITFRELVNHFGGARAALDALPELSRRGGRGRAIRIFPAGAAEAELAAADRVGAIPVFTIEPGYPRRLAWLDAPPPVIYVKGNTDLLSRPSLAIVGSRQSSAAGQKFARVVAGDLGCAGVVVVSGLARGIDGAAHEASLRWGTVAVVAGGLDVIYPPEHADLHRRIGEEGCLVAEQPPGFVPRGQDFPRRNRIISGIALGVLVVEAARRSGSLITARMAGEQGREVFAAPGHPLDPRAEGTNQLIKQGATLVTGAEDIIEALQPLAGGMLGEARAGEGDLASHWTVPGVQTPSAGEADDMPRLGPQPPPLVTDDARDRIVRALGPAPIDIDEIGRAVGLPVRTVRLVLVELDLAGRIEHHGRQLVSLRSGPEPGPD